MTDIEHNYLFDWKLERGVKVEELNIPSEEDYKFSCWHEYDLYNSWHYSKPVKVIKLLTYIKPIYEKQTIWTLKMAQALSHLKFKYIPEDVTAEDWLNII